MNKFWNLYINRKTIRNTTIRSFCMHSCLRNLGQILLRLTPAGSACAHQLGVTCFTWFQGNRNKFRFFSLMLSHILSVDSYQHQRSSRFIFDILKLNFCQHVFGLNFPSVHSDSIIFTANLIKANCAGYLESHCKKFCTWSEFLGCHRFQASEN